MNSPKCLGTYVSFPDLKKDENGGKSSWNFQERSHKRPGTNSEKRSPFTLKKLFICQNMNTFKTKDTFQRSI